MIKPRNPSFEDSYPIIDAQIQKARSKWNLSAIAWMDFDDVAQIVRIHINKKWHQYNPKEGPIVPWISKIISNQIKNLVRNNYGNYSRPCLRCAAAEGGDLCLLYGKQCSACPLYKKWEQTKKIAYDTKLPVALENHSQEVFNMADNSIDIERIFKFLNSKAHIILKPKELRVYKLLYIDNKTEEEAAVIMGYQTTEKNRSPGYKQIKNIQKNIMLKIKKFINDGGVDILS